MYAVIETGGKQYRVELGSELAVERLDATPGSSISFERVLLVADGDNAQVGTPTVADALVTADVVRQDRGDKVIVFKYRPKARHRSKKGHRQEQTVIRVADIRFNGRSAAEEAGAQKAEESEARERAQAEAERKAAADQALAAKLAADAQAKQAASTAQSDTGDEGTAAKPTARRRAAKAVEAEPETTEAAESAQSADEPEVQPERDAGVDPTQATETKKTTRSRSTKKDE